MRLRGITLVAVALAVGALGASCSSSAKTASQGTPPGSAAPGTTASPNGSCPFSGTTTSQSNPGGSASTELKSVSPTPAGCIDNVTLSFSKTLAPSVAAYQAAPAGATGAVLVVTLNDTTLGSGLKPGTTHPTNVSYVSAVKLSASSGNVVYDITLDKKRPFLVSATQVPPQLVISVG